MAIYKVFISILLACFLRHVLFYVLQNLQPKDIVFRFYQKFSERDMKEITVEDVILEEFIELLNVVYPSHKPVSGVFKYTKLLFEEINLLPYSG